MKAAARRRFSIAGLTIGLLASVWGIAVMAGAGGASPHDEEGVANLARLQFNLTPQTLPTAAGEVTATPTPRVIVIPTSTASAPPAVTPPVATSTPQSIVIVEPTAAVDAPPTQTPTPIPTAAPLPTTTPPPPPIAAVGVPTVAPARAIRLDFAAEDWSGGYYRGDSSAYGRPWVAVYGELSDYPRATLTFTLDTTPGAPATVSITGLDDELGALNPVALEVNGQRVFAGPSPFLNWDGAGAGENAAWTTVPFTIPSGVLQAGSNEITFANLTPVASFGVPPYVLLADTTLEIPGGAAGESTTPAPPPIVPSTSATAFTAEDWAGGFYRGDDVFYGRPWTAIYGAASEYPRAMLRFRLDGEPTAPATLTITGLDDELADLNPIALEVNGQQFFAGPSPFLNWDGIGNGDAAAWTEVEITIPVDLLRSGRNEIAIANLSPSANFSAPPYILLGDATLAAPGSEVTASSRDGDRRQDRGRRDNDADD